MQIVTLVETLVEAPTIVLEPLEAATAIDPASQAVDKEVSH